jgi:hypothetical protein
VVVTTVADLQEECLAVHVAGARKMHLELEFTGTLYLNYFFKNKNLIFKFYENLKICVYIENDVYFKCIISQSKICCIIGYIIN